MIQLQTKEDTDKRKCPFIMSTTGYPIICKNNECMSWTIVQKKISREDHSGGKEFMSSIARCFGVTLNRDKAFASEGLWFINELGYCRRLWSTVGIVTAEEYLKEKV